MSKRMFSANSNKAVILYILRSNFMVEHKGSIIGLNRMCISSGYGGCGNVKFWVMSESMQVAHITRIC